MNGGNQNNEKRRKFLLFLLLSYQNWFGHCLQFTYFKTYWGCFNNPSTPSCATPSVCNLYFSFLSTPTCRGSRRNKLSDILITLKSINDKKI